jgi:PPOX class probable F420-dependent enzyme
MPELTPAVRQFLHDNDVGVVATERPDGLPRQTVVYHVLDGDRILISTTHDRAKARDVERTGRASYAVMGHAKPYPQVVVTGPARIVRTGIAETTGRLFGRITGSAPEPPLTDEALAGMNRVILELTIERVAAASYLPAEG